MLSRQTHYDSQIIFKSVASFTSALSTTDRAPPVVQEDHQDADVLNGRTGESWFLQEAVPEGRASIYDANPISGRNMLFYGTSRGHCGVVRFLLDIGVDI